MLICFPWKGSGGGVVYGCGVWRVKSWVKNVLNTNKYIAISPIKWGWSPLTYLPLVVIIFEKSIILFYWTPYRGIDTHYLQRAHAVKSYWTPYRGIDTYFLFLMKIILIALPIEPLIGGLILALQARCRCLQLPIEPLIGGLIRVEKWRSTVVYLYWTPYRGIDTVKPPKWYFHINPIEPLIGGLIHCCSSFFHKGITKLFIYWTPYRGIDTFRQLTPSESTIIAIEPLIGGLIHGVCLTVNSFQLLNPL